MARKGMLVRHIHGKTCQRGEIGLAKLAKLFLVMAMVAVALCGCGQTSMQSAEKIANKASEISGEYVADDVSANACAPKGKSLLEPGDLDDAGDVAALFSSETAEQLIGHWQIYAFSSDSGKTFDYMSECLTTSEIEGIYLDLNKDGTVYLSYFANDDHDGIWEPTSTDKIPVGCLIEVGDFHFTGRLDDFGGTEPLLALISREALSYVVVYQRVDSEIKNRTVPVEDFSVPSASAATSEQSGALKKAENYLNVMAFSYESLVEQLEYEGFSSGAALWAADHCGADWAQQAVRKANEYLETTAFSYSGLVEQLEYEGFSYEDATYGATACDADWLEQAAEKARDYLAVMDFSRAELIAQLEYEGFTSEQAAYGARAAGL